MAIPGIGCLKYQHDDVGETVIENEFLFAVFCDGV